MTSRRPTARLPRHSARRLAALWCLWSAWGGAGAGGPLWIDPQLEHHQRLAPVTMQEVAGPEGLAVSMGRWDGPHSLMAGLARSRAQARRLSRELTTVWRVSLPAGTGLDRLRVRYEIDGTSGCGNCLSAAGRGDADLPVTLIPIAPRVVRWDRDSPLVEGGVALGLDLERARLAGEYQGTLTWHVDTD